MSARARLRDFPVFAFAFAGLIVGHLLSYAIAIPDPARRALVLARSGHAYLHLAGDVAVIVGFAAFVTVALRATIEGAVARASAARLASRLGAVQAGAFIVMELGERVLTGGGFGDLGGDHLFAVGIVVQLAIAGIGALLLRWLVRAVARMAEALARAPRRRPIGASWGLVTTSLIPRPALAGTIAARAPPFP